MRPPADVKRRKTSTASSFANSDSEESEGEEQETGEEQDELAAYLALPQIKMKTVRGTGLAVDVSWQVLT